MLLGVNKLRLILYHFSCIKIDLLGLLGFVGLFKKSLKFQNSLAHPDPEIQKTNDQLITAII